MHPNPPTHIGRYELLDRLGEGGMGVLYLARDPLLGRTVAIKVLSVDNEELRERFAREARSAASLKHNHIVTIYDVGVDRGAPFIAMEYLDGETMAELIRRRAPLPVARRLQLMLELCSGLGYAHRSGIIHRDIKPANVMLTTDGSLKILDFGLARLSNDVTGAGLTRAGAMLGTPHYMAPEQIQGKPVDHRSDIFAAGLVLYELLTYRKAYSGDGALAVLHNIVHTEPTPLRDVYPDVDPELERAVAKAIEKDPARRYQSLGELGSDLGRVRDRLLGSAAEATVRMARAADTPAPSSGRLSSAPEVHTPAITPRIPNLDAIARRRSAQIELHLDEAVKHFADGRYEAAIEQCELAAVLDPGEQRALDLLHQAHRELEGRQVQEWLRDAQAQLSRGALSEAEQLIQRSLEMRPESVEAHLLQNELKTRRREQERALERARAVRTAIERARANLEAGALEAAVRSASEALAHDPASEDAKALKAEALAALEERRRQQEHEQRAFDLVGSARQQAVRGELQSALQRLRDFSPPHPIVDEAITEIQSEIEALEQRRREEEAARRQRALEEEQRRRDAERLAREMEEARRRQEEEERRRGAEARARQAAVAARKSAAREALDQDRFEDALGELNQIRTLAPLDPELERLTAAIHEARSRVEAAARRRELLEQHLKEASDCLRTGETNAAARFYQAAVDLAPEDPRVRDLRTTLERARQQQEQEGLQRRAGETVARARRMAAAGHHDGGIRLLREFSPPSLVADALEQLEAEQRELKQREQDEARRRATESEAHQKEAGRLAAEEQQRRIAAAALARAKAERRAAAEATRREEEARHRAAEEEQRRAAAAAQARAEAERRAAAEAARREEERRHRAEEEEQRRAAAAAQARADADARARTAAPDQALEDTQSWQEPVVDQRIARPREGWSRGRMLQATAAVVIISASLIGAWYALYPEEDATGRPSHTDVHLPPPDPVGKPSQPPAAAGDPLFVTVHSVPWSRVRITSSKDAGGAIAPIEGTTPFVVRIPEGEYRVECRSDLVKQPYVQTIQVRGGSDNVVRIVLPGFDVNRIVDEILRSR